MTRPSSSSSSRSSSLPARRFQRHSRRLHRLLVPIAAAPLLLTALTGSLYSVLLERGIDAFWLLKLHTGQFGPLNLQPYYSAILGLLSLVIIASGTALLFGGRWSRPRPI